MLARILEQVGVPRGVVNIITGDGPEAGAALVAHPKVDKIAFTGGTDAGRAIIKNSADTIKRLTMELGGKNPNIVFADADFDAAIDGALFGAFANQGEVCSAGSRLLVDEKIYAKFVKELAERGKRVRIGNPLERETKMGPLVTKEHRERVLSYIEIGKKEGKLVLGGGTPKDGELAKGWFVEPTIFIDVAHEARVSREEIFGPVLTVTPFKTEADAVRMANDTPYGLAAGVWTRDVMKGVRVMKDVRAGIQWLNTYHPTYNEAPWGGFKQSGFGRELGLFGIEGYLEIKQININLREEPIGWY
jgi:betaine-aldehyde dehydrogenase